MENEIIHVGLTYDQLLLIWRGIAKLPITEQTMALSFNVEIAIRQVRPDWKRENAARPDKDHGRSPADTAEEVTGKRR